MGDKSLRDQETPGGGQNLPQTCQSLPALLSLLLSSMSLAQVPHTSFFPLSSNKSKQRILRASLVAQSVKNLPAMQETRLQSLGWEDSPGEGNGNLLQYSCLENPMGRGTWRVTVYGVTRVRHNLATKPPPLQGTMSLPCPGSREHITAG